MTCKIPVERLHEYDRVRAVHGGPVGTVIDADRCGWVIVKYWDRSGRSALVSYRHGEDRLYLEEAVAA